MAAKVPLLLDTDIGSDIDDALALAYLLAHPRCELLGVATATGDTEKRAALAHHLCRAAKRHDVPVLAGRAEPIGMGPGQPQVPQYEAIEGKHDYYDYGPMDGSAAIAYMANVIHAAPGQVTLLAIGPLTNVATLFSQHPDVPRLLKRVVLMCGAFHCRPDREVPDREWNARCDPAATEIVFGNVRPDSLVSVGLDVTLDCVLPLDECRRRFQAGGPLLQAVDELASVWFKDAASITFHDPLAAAFVFHPELCELVAGEVNVEPDGTIAEGATRFHPHDDGPIRVCSGVKTAAFFTHYFDIVSGYHGA